MNSIASKTQQGIVDKVLSDMLIEFLKKLLARQDVTFSPFDS